MSDVPHTRAAYDALRRTIECHDRLYYVDAQPEITDRAYDALFAALVAAENAHPAWVAPTSPTQRVSETRLGGFETVRHSVFAFSRFGAVSSRVTSASVARPRAADSDCSSSQMLSACFSHG